MLHPEVPDVCLMKTEVVLKSLRLIDNFTRPMSLMKTEVVLKSTWKTEQQKAVAFNENRSCIEICLDHYYNNLVSCLMKTEVVLKFGKSGYGIDYNNCLMKTEVVLKSNSHWFSRIS